MAVVGYLFLLAVCLHSLVESVTLNCAECYGVLDPTTCHTVKKCHAENHHCVTEAYNLNGQIQYDLSCQPAIGGCHAHTIFGKRNIVSRCKQCCRHENCNIHLCANIVSMHATKASTAAPTTTTPLQTTNILNIAPSPEPGCRDHEEDGILCTHLDLFDVCKQTSALAGVVAKGKCRKHCGICVPTAPPPTYAVGPIPQTGVCTNYEKDGITCSHYDQYSLCNHTSTLGHVLATMKCSQYCGFCNATTAPLTSALTTPSVSTQPTTMTSPPFVFTATKPHSTKAAFTANHTLHTTLLNPLCFDIEDNIVNCTHLKAIGDCIPQANIGWQTARLRCRKTCGYCT